MKKNIAIVCNSINEDLSTYFIRSSEVIKRLNFGDRVLFLKNKHIQLDPKLVSYNSSFMLKSFADPRFLLDLLILPMVCYQLLKLRVKEVHFTTAHLSNVPLSVMLKIFNIKIISTIHDLVPHPGAKSSFIRIYNFFFIRLLSYKIISFSKTEIRKLNNSKIIFMPLAGFKRRANTPKKGETILFFGRIDKYKGISNLLEIVKLVNQKSKKSIPFVVAGKGYDENLNLLKQFGNVEVINRYIESSEIKLLFDRASFTILPYHSATQSGIIILSYSYATPVIAFDVGGLREYVFDNKTGKVITAGNNELMANEILELFDSELVEEYSNNCLKIFNELYSSEAFYKQYENFYSDLLLK